MRWRKLLQSPGPDPGSLGEALEEIIRAERETVNVVPPKLSDADRANIWQRTAEARLAKMDDLRAENDRLRADLALARAANRGLRAAGPADCGHRATLAHYDALLAACRAEHLDGDEAERLRNAAYPKLEVPW